MTAYLLVPWCARRHEIAAAARTGDFVNLCFLGQGLLRTSYQGRLARKSIWGLLLFWAPQTMYFHDTKPKFPKSAPLPPSQEVKPPIQKSFEIQYLQLIREKYLLWLFFNRILKVIAFRKGKKLTLALKKIFGLFCILKTEN